MTKAIKANSLISFILLSMAFTVFSADQEIAAKIKELEQKISKLTGQGKVDALNDLSFDYYEQSVEKSLAYGKQALALSKEIAYAKGEGFALFNLSRGLMQSGDYAQALKLAQESLQQREMIGDKKGVAASFNVIGQINCDLGNYSEALNCYSKSLNIGKEIGDKKGIAYVYLNIGGVHAELGNHDKALENFLKSLQLHEQIGNKAGVSGALNNIGNIYSNLGDLNKALEYMFKSVKIHEEIGNKYGIAVSYSNIARIYSDLGNYDKSLEYLSKALKIWEEIGNSIGIMGALINFGAIYDWLNNNDKALEYGLKALKMAEKFHDKRRIALAAGNVGRIYWKLNKNHDALKYQIQALKIREEIGDKDGVVLSLNNLGLVYRTLKNFERAEKYMKKSLALSKAIKEKQSESDNYNCLSALYKDKKDFKKALEYHELFYEKEKEILNEKSNKQIAEMQTRYETEKKETKIQALEKDKKLSAQREQLQELRLSRSRIIRNASVIGFLLVTVIMLLLFKKYLYFFAFWKKEKYIGRYRLLDVIGAGGMSVVYKAHSIKEKTEKVAVKILKQEFAGDDSIVKRFKQEAVIIDKLDHPNIVKVYERGEDKNRLFIAMEYLEGKTLAEKIAKESPIALGACWHIMSQLADALAQIHAHKIIHRDLKPSNVVLTSRSGDDLFVKLLDFGLARMRFQSTLTQTGELLGTIGYMSPEQLLDKEITTASDIYSLGVIFYEIVCGRRAFAADNEIQIIQRILDELPAEPRSIRPEIPVEWNLLILKMLEKKPMHRPSLTDFREKLKLFSKNLL